MEQSLGGRWNSANGIYTFDCNAGSDPDLGLDFDFGLGSAAAAGPSIHVPMSSMLYPVTYKSGQPYILGGINQCLLLVGSTTDDRITILGDSFLRNAYVVYDLDNNEISMAQANLDSDTSETNITRIPSSGIANFKDQLLNSNASVYGVTVSADLYPKVNTVSTVYHHGMAATATGFTDPDETGSSRSESNRHSAGSHTRVPLFVLAGLVSCCLFY